MKRLSIAFITVILLSLSSTAFARDHHGHGGGGNFWSGFLTGVVVDTVVRETTRPRVVYYPAPEPAYAPQQQYPGEYGYCNGSAEYCRGRADAERRRYEEWRQREYERGLRDGGGY